MWDRRFRLSPLHRWPVHRSHTHRSLRAPTGPQHLALLVQRILHQLPRSRIPSPAPGTRSAHIAHQGEQGIAYWRTRNFADIHSSYSPNGAKLFIVD
jgi:hypothetical protein